MNHLDDIPEWEFEDIEESSLDVPDSLTHEALVTAPAGVTTPARTDRPSAAVATAPAEQAARTATPETTSTKAAIPEAPAFEVAEPETIAPDAAGAVPVATGMATPAAQSAFEQPVVEQQAFEQPAATEPEALLARTAALLTQDVVGTSPAEVEALAELIRQVRAMSLSAEAFDKAFAKLNHERLDAIKQELEFGLDHGSLPWGSGNPEARAHAWVMSGKQPLHEDYRHLQHLLGEFGQWLVRREREQAQPAYNAKEESIYNRFRKEIAVRVESIRAAGHEPRRCIRTATQQTAWLQCQYDDGSRYNQFRQRADLFRLRAFLLTHGDLLAAENLLRKQNSRTDNLGPLLKAFDATLGKLEMRADQLFKMSSATERAQFAKLAPMAYERSEDMVTAVSGSSSRLGVPEELRDIAAVASASPHVGPVLKAACELEPSLHQLTLLNWCLTSVINEVAQTLPNTSVKSTLNEKLESIAAHHRASAPAIAAFASPRLAYARMQHEADIFDQDVIAKTAQGFQQFVQELGTSLGMDLGGVKLARRRQTRTGQEFEQALTECLAKPSGKYQMVLGLVPAMLPALLGKQAVEDMRLRYLRGNDVLNNLHWKIGTAVIEQFARSHFQLDTAVLQRCLYEGKKQLGKLRENDKPNNVVGLRKVALLHFRSTQAPLTAEEQRELDHRMRQCEQFFNAGQDAAGQDPSIK